MTENGHPSYGERLAAVQEGVVRVVERYGRDPEMLIQMLLELQAEFRWLPEEMLAALARTLETVNCVGCCPIAPVVLCGEHYHGKVRPAGVKELLAAYQ